MARKKKPDGHKKIVDMLDCGIELIAEKGNRGQRGYIFASCQKVGDSYILHIGNSKTVATDATQLMQDMDDFKPLVNWLGDEPRNKHTVVQRDIEVITLDVSSPVSKRRR